jgi:predicted RNA-binding Zn-ribbon protein involved in translation (DUF1610 family)
MEEERIEKCNKCNKKVIAKLHWRENGEGEYKCSKCGKDLIRFRRVD